ncbi:MAG: DUF1653 domain-containing protein [Solobacterium sp.]|nr:DUF1653 domain-containing protein [Solobacterium sp.]
MTEKRFPAGTVVRHFKRQYAEPDSTMYLYRIIAEAEHTETGEMLVVFQALYGDRRVFARPASMFYEKTDTGKYPDARQEYRFEEASEEEKELVRQ